MKSEACRDLKKAAIAKYTLERAFLKKILIKTILYKEKQYSNLHFCIYWQFNL